jgi:hypothetical protein
MKLVINKWYVSKSTKVRGFLRLNPDSIFEYYTYGNPKRIGTYGEYSYNEKSWNVGLYKTLTCINIEI